MCFVCVRGSETYKKRTLTESACAARNSSNAAASGASRRATTEECTAQKALPGAPLGRQH